MSVRDLAIAADVTPATISYVENGRTTPRQSTIRRISEALGVSPDEVLEFAATKNSRTRERAQDES